MVPDFFSNYVSADFFSDIKVGLEHTNNKGNGLPGFTTNSYSDLLFPLFLFVGVQKNEICVKLSKKIGGWFIEKE